LRLRTPQERCPYGFYCRDTRPRVSVNDVQGRNDTEQR